MSIEPGQFILKDPDAVLPYTWLWADLLGEGVTISDSDWIIDGPDSDLVVDDDDVIDSNQNAQVWLSGGTPNKTYTVTNRITASDGRIDDRTISVRVRER